MVVPESLILGRFEDLVTLMLSVIHTSRFLFESVA
jgi:hypothetical protein